MPELELWHVNVFSKNPFGGNPAAVGFCKTSLDATTMQSIARTMNLSESVFISSAQDKRADYCARIFTVRREVAFAAHPTIAAAFAFLQKYGVVGTGCPGTIRQECSAGIVEIEPTIRPGGSSLFVAQRDPRYQDVNTSREDIACALGCATDAVSDAPVAVVSTGVPWLIVELTTLQAMRTLAPDYKKIASLSTAVAAVGITVFTRKTSDPARDVHLRSFAPAEGIYEDPVCGSCHGALAAYLSRHCAQISEALQDGRSLRFEQGDEIGLPGFSEVIARKRGGGMQYLVGGEAVVTMKGTMHW
jgi:PhzF family phenazine biosynthesis protein